MTLRLGIFGGTFDPIHVGHLIVAEVARQILQLHRVLFVPARIPPHKKQIPTPPESRLAMVRLACAGNPHFEVSDVELEREGPSYTVDTIQMIRRQSAPDTHLFLLIGADSARDFPTWKHHEAILADANVVVMGRPGTEIDSVSPTFGHRMTFLPTPLIELSSSEIRRLAHEGGSIRYMVTDAVESYIRSENLYGPRKDRS